MTLVMDVARRVVCDLRERGYIHVAEHLDLPQYQRLASAVGEIVSEEEITLRPGAHAYVAKPGRVPLHTDHPQVDVVGWLCVEQDDLDGATMLLDAHPVVDSLPTAERRTLYEVEIWCPPLGGGPPTLRWPVLRATMQGNAVFCSPWLRSADSIASHVRALDLFRMSLSAAAKDSSVSIRLAPGQSIFVDNRRVLHGRRAIAEGSRRRLHRLWITVGSR